MFSAVVIMLFTAVSLSIYFFSADYREDDFYKRLKNKALNAAQLLIEVEEVDANLLMKIERDNPSNLPNERIIIYDYKNEELYSSDAENEIKIDSATLDEIRLRKEIRFKSGEYEVLGFLFTERYDRITVVAAAKDIYGISKMKNLRNILLLIFFMSVIIVPISGWIYSGRALSPIFNLVRQTESISAAHLNLRLVTNNKTDEIGKLVQTFNLMLDRLENAFLAQKYFIANASHELRTPLTSITGEIEVTLIRPRAVEEYQDVLRSVLEEIASLSQLSNQLLLLAQTSAEPKKQELALQRVDELLWQAKEELVKSHPDYNIDIDLDVHLDDRSLTVLGDEQLLKIAFSNLLDNGCKYSDNNSVVVRLKSIQRAITIEFQNEGMGIVPQELNTIFQPFFRGSNTRNLKGHGIGLSLVHRIISLHEGSIEVTSKMGGKTMFTISIPEA